MTKKNKIVVGSIIGGVVVLGAIGSASNKTEDNISNNSSLNSESSYVSAIDNNIPDTFEAVSVPANVEAEKSSISLSEPTSSVTAPETTKPQTTPATTTTAAPPETTPATTTTAATTTPATTATTPAPQTTPATTTTAATTTAATTTSIPVATQQIADVVYIAATGKGTKYHKDPNCSKMDGNVIKMTTEEAEAAGYGPCQKSSCYGSHF